jgi:anaerobic selenocysteine-containing dehydrogenase
LTVTVRGGRVTKIDGATANHITDGYICAKVRRFPERVYGEDRLLYPAMRRGAKGSGLFKRVTWDDAPDLIAEDAETRDRAGANRSAAWLRRLAGSHADHADAILSRRFGIATLRMVCAAPTGG